MNRNIFFRWLVAGLLLSLPLRTHCGTASKGGFDLAADTLSIEAEFERCTDSLGTSTMSMTMCLIRREKAWEKEMNKVYKMCMRASDKRERELLQSFQKDWLVFRDKGTGYCLNMYNWDIIGTIGRLQVVDCRTDFIRKRVLWLTEYLGERQ